MKKCLFLSSVLFALVAFVGCSSDDDPKVEMPTLKLSTNVVSISADGTASIVEVTTNQTSWKASRPEADAWCVLKQENNKLSVSATVNETLTERTTKITVVAGIGADAKTEEIVVTQSAANAYLTVEGLETGVPVRLDAIGTSVELTINTNAATWTAVRPETDTWCTLTQEGNKLKIAAEAYTEDAERTTKVTISGGVESVIFDVVQKGEVPAAPVYAITIPTDFSESYVQKVMVDGVKVAEICKEYLRSTTAGAEVDAQMTVIYPVIDGHADLTKGLVLDNGGTVAWDIENNTCTYTAGTVTDALTTVYMSEGNLLIDTESTNINAVVVEPELLVDARPGDTKWSYKIVKIGTQYWMAENLKARYYINGTSIPMITTDTDWKTTESGAYRNPDFQTENFLTYGASYNGYSVLEEKGLAPMGWTIPEMEDFQKLKKYVATSVGTKLKSVSDWSKNPGTNITGFNVLPAGQYNPVGETDNITTSAGFWTKTKVRDFLGNSLVYVSLSDSDKGKDNFVIDKVLTLHTYNYGHTIRCLKQTSISQ